MLASVAAVRAAIRSCSGDTRYRESEIRLSNSALNSRTIALGICDCYARGSFAAEFDWQLERGRCLHALGPRIGPSPRDILRLDIDRGVWPEAGDGSSRFSRSKARRCCLKRWR